MPRLSRSALLCCVFLAPGLALAAAAPAAAPATAPAVPARVVERDGVWAQSYSDIAPDSNVRFGQLPNGVRYAVMHNNTPKNQVSVRLLMGTGSMSETDAQQGLAHFLEHMAFKGSKKVPAGEIIKKLQRLGLAFGADTNASTNMEITDYRFDLPKADAESIDTGLLLVRETASELTLDAKEMDTERGVVLSEERLRDSPGYRAYVAQLKYLMPGQIAADRIPIGKVDVLKNAPVSELANYYRTHYRPERATVVVVGDVDVDAVEGKIKTLFSDWKAATPAPKPIAYGTPKARKLETRIFTEPGTSFEIDLDWTNPYDNSGDTVANRRRDSVRNVAIGVLNRRLSRIAQQPDPPFQRASASRNNMLHSVDLAEFSVSATPENWEKALMAAEATRRQAVEFGVRQDEVDEILTESRTGREAAVNGASTRTSPRLAGELESAAANNNVFSSPAENLALFDRTLKGLTAAEVSAAMKDIFQGNGPLMFVATPKAVDGGEATFTTALAKADSAPITAAVAEAEKAWPYTNFGTPGKDVERKTVDDLGATFVHFANGVRLTVKPTTFSKDQIVVNVRIGDGLRALTPDKLPPLWATSAFSAGGLKELNADQIRRVFAGKVTGMGFSVGEDAIQLGGTTRAADLDAEMQLLAAYATEPGYRAEAFERIRTAYKTRLDEISATPRGVLGHAMGQLMHSGDPRWRSPDKPEVADAKLTELQDMIQNQLTKGEIEVVMAGDVTVDQAVAAVASTFGAFPARGKPAAVPAKNLAVRFPEAKDSPAPLQHTGRGDQAMGVIGWRTDDFFADPQRARATRMLEQIFRIRLTEQFRIAEGSTYSPGTDFDASENFPHYGYLLAQVETPPAKMDRFFEVAQKIAADIRDHGVTADEMERARLPRIEALTHARESNGYWAGALAGAQTDPRKIDAVREMITGLEKVTADDVKKVAQMYLTDAHAWKLTVLPAKPSL